jgi:glutathione S-transferase
VALDDGRPLAESNATLWHFTDGSPYLPDDPYERAQVLQWMFFEQYKHEPITAEAA